MPEIIVALLLGLLVVHLGLNTLSRLDAARTRIAARTDALVALRVTRHVVRRETRYGVGGEDWAVGGDSLALRAFRGVAVVCRNDPSTAELLVSYHGDRAPDPRKDSLVLVTGEGGRVVRALTSTTAPPIRCEGLEAGADAVWRLDAAAPAGTTLAMLFERGSYHLSGSALRYRRGAGGRQPLTPEVLAPSTRWTASANWVGIELVPQDHAAGGPWRVLVSLVP
jgi:hypothetical protein